MNTECFTEEQKKLFYKLSDCGLAPISDALKIQIENSNIYNDLSFEERLAELITAYDDALTSQRTAALLKQSKLKSKLSFNDITVSNERGFNSDLARRISSLGWTRPGKISNITVLGASGTGKTTLLCGIGHHCICHGLSVRYYKAGQLLKDLLDSSLYKVRSLKSTIRRSKIIIIDDLGMNKASDEASNVFYDLLDERVNELPVIVGSQVNEEGLRACFTGKAQADGILRRLFQNSTNIVLKGDPEDAEAREHGIIEQETAHG
jgi:DNA replication protein DnaC